WTSGLLTLELSAIRSELPETGNPVIHGFKGSCYYFHYGLQGIDDRGWGCGYRTLQTILSWFLLNHYSAFEMPDLFQIQELLCDIGDKPENFHRSKEWIGSFECGVVVELLTQVKVQHRPETTAQQNFRLLHVPKGSFTGKQLDILRNHFIDVGSPVMMGGCEDSSSKGVLAIRESLCKTELLICDPHLHNSGEEPSLQEVCSKGWIKWQDTTELREHAFYNLCLPLLSL
ncbi:Ubiquitin-fold modifier-1 (Ufm1) specific protease (UfSP), partial [Fasciolopsis buskii]